MTCTRCNTKLTEHEINGMKKYGQVCQLCRLRAVFMIIPALKGVAEKMKKWRG